MKKITLLTFLFLTPLPIYASDQLLKLAHDYQQKEEFGKAITIYKEIIKENTENTSALFSLGCCYLANGKIEKALSSFKKVKHLSPHTISAYYNIGYALKTAGRLNEAIEVYEEIIAAHPNYEPAQLALGFAYLMNGEFEKGWKQHERYLKQSGKNGNELRELLKKNDITGKTILLKQEGGLGDTLHFIRYAERLKSMGARIIAVTPKSLTPLLSRCHYIDQLLVTGSPRPYCDAHASLMSLPAIFCDTETTFPKTIPYIFPDPDLVHFWKSKVNNNSFNIGICWQADVHNDSSRLPIARRGIPLNNFFVLSTLNNVHFYSLQKNDGVEQLNDVPSYFPLQVFDTLDEQNGPFMDTCALMCNLDLIITVDTAIAHLAGALGKRVWLLLPYSTDWRWINNRTDSPWYPTMKIFKQQKPFDYQGIIETVYLELKILLKEKPS